MDKSCSVETRRQFFDMFAQMVYVIDRMHALLPGEYGCGDLSRQLTTFDEVRNIFQKINGLLYPGMPVKEVPVEAGRGWMAGRWVAERLFNGDPSGLPDHVIDSEYASLKTRIEELEVALGLVALAAEGRSDLQPTDYGWTPAYAATKELRDRLHALESQQPVGWERVESSGPESLCPMYVKGAEFPPYDAKYEPRYASVDPGKGVLSAETLRQHIKSNVVGMLRAVADPTVSCSEWLNSNRENLPYTGIRRVMEIGNELAAKRLQELADKL